MFKKTFLSLSCAAALAAGVAPAFASSTFHLVVPLSARTLAQEPADSIAVSLAGAALPAATVSKPYSESLRPYLSVTGDAAFDSSAARWSLAEGTLPAGLSLDETTGAVAGTPTAKTTTPASFTVLATYKGADGQAVYTIEVGGVALNVSKISAGSNYTCAITDTGGVKCWGQNSNGQLGDNSTTGRIIPVDVEGLASGVSNVFSSQSHTCAVMNSGAAKCWGNNSSGQLGNNTSSLYKAPITVTGFGNEVTSLALGGNHTCALTANGQVKCVGSNNFGQLGDSSSTSRSTPVDVVGLDSGVTVISAKANSTCAVVNGAAKCWGDNNYGHLGDGTTSLRTAPVDVSGLSEGVASIATGGRHTCALTTAGAVKCWGYNVNGQLGDNSKADSKTPVSVINPQSDFSRISVGLSHTCALTTSGVAKCWGSNSNGRLGDNSSTSRHIPVDVVGLGTGVTDISAGATQSCAIASGIAKCWGFNSNGQLGDNSTSDRYTPVDVQGSQ